MENFLKKMNQRFDFMKNPRLKFLGCFLIIISFIGETPLRKISHFLSDGLLFLIGGDISGAGIIIDKLFVIGAPIIFVYIPITIALWVIIKDGFQKLDWIFAPILIGILIKGGVYGIVSLYSKSSEFWELTQQGVSGFFLWCFILIFLISGLAGLVMWFKKIL